MGKQYSQSNLNMSSTSKARSGASLNILSSPRSGSVQKPKTFIEDILLASGSLGSTANSGNINLILKGIKERNVLHIKNYRFWEKYTSEVIYWLILSGRDGLIEMEISL